MSFKSKLLATTFVPMALAVGAGFAMGTVSGAIFSSPAVAACAAKNPCCAKNPCGAGCANPCAAKNPCNPCLAKNPCNPCNPCAAKKN